LGLVKYAIWDERNDSHFLMLVDMFFVVVNECLLSWWSYWYVLFSLKMMFRKSMISLLTLIVNHIIYFLLEGLLVLHWKWQVHHLGRVICWHLSLELGKWKQLNIQIFAGSNYENFTVYKCLKSILIKMPWRMSYHKTGFFYFQCISRSTLT